MINERGEWVALNLWIRGGDVPSPESGQVLEDQKLVEQKRPTLAGRWMKGGNRLDRHWNGNHLSLGWGGDFLVIQGCAVHVGVTRGAVIMVNQDFFPGLAACQQAERLV